MRNLAGVADADNYILSELLEAGITPVKITEPNAGEVPYTYTGLLTTRAHGEFTFIRAWYYWMVEGYVPYDIAKQYFKFDKSNIRIHGDVDGNVDLRKWSKIYRVADKKQALSAKQYKKYEKIYDSLWNENQHKYCIADDTSDTSVYSRYVTSYHIDTQPALNLFVRLLTK